MPDKKLEVVSPKDVKALKGQLTALESEVRDHVESFKSIQGQTENIFEDLRGISEKNEGSAKAIKDHQALIVHISGVVDGHAERLEMFRRAQMYIDGTMEKGHQEVKSKFDRLEGNVAALGSRMDEQLQAIRDELNARIDTLTQDAKQQAQDSIGAATKEVRFELQNSSAALEEQLKRHVETAESRAIITSQERLRSEVERLQSELSAHGDKHQADLHTKVQTARTEAADGHTSIRTSLQNEIGKMDATLNSTMLKKGEAVDARLKKLEDTIEQSVAKLNALSESHNTVAFEVLGTITESGAKLSALSQDTFTRLEDMEGRIAPLKAVGGLPTRQVDWDITKGIDRFRELQVAGGVGLCSPTFDAAGSSGLQLELRPLRGDEPEDGQGRPADCSLVLHAPPGVHLLCKLWVGTESIVMKHDFIDGGAPYVWPRACMLKEQVDHSSGTVRAGIEIHEASFDVRTDASDMPASTHATGSVVSKRYLNNKMLELIQSQSRGLSDYVLKKVDAMRSKAVRRVQWRLESAFKLKESFMEGRPVCSTAFQAAGVNGLQLIFYPSGCTGAKEGFCSFFLSCPPGCTVRCWLWAGRWRKEARPEASDKNDLLGRINFCRFENCVDPNDESVELALEIEEAQQQMANPGQAGTMLPDLSTQRIDGSVDPMVSMSRSDTVINKLQVNKGKNNEGVKQLPSLFPQGSFDETTKPGGGYNAEGVNQVSPGSTARQKTVVGGAKTPRQIAVSPRKVGRQPNASPSQSGSRQLNSSC